MKKLPVILMFILLGFVGCTPEPPLHLYDEAAVNFDMPVIDLSLEVYWDYEIAFGV